jgi:hypothetical protein
MRIRVKSKEEIQKLLKKNNYGDSAKYLYNFVPSMFGLCGRWFEAEERNSNNMTVYLIDERINLWALYREWVEIIPSIIEVDDED